MDVSSRRVSLGGAYQELVVGLDVQGVPAAAVRRSTRGAGGARACHVMLFRAVGTAAETFAPPRPIGWGRFVGSVWRRGVNLAVVVNDLRVSCDSDAGVPCTDENRLKTL